MKNKTKKYSIVIVLSPEIDKDDGGNIIFPDYFEEKYFGSKIRIDVAEKLYKNCRTKKLIVVGGPSKKFPEIQKSKVIKESLVKRDVPDERIVAVPSKAKTRDNFPAVFRYFKKKGINIDNSKHKLGFLTNFYHIPRATKFMFEAVESFREEIKGDFYIEPIAAESLLSTSKYIKHLLKNYFIERIEMETQGLRDIENGEYGKK